MAVHLIQKTGFSYLVIRRAFKVGIIDLSAVLQRDRPKTTKLNFGSQQGIASYDGYRFWDDFRACTMVALQINIKLEAKQGTTYN